MLKFEQASPIVVFHDFLGLVFLMGQANCVSLKFSISIHFETNLLKIQNIEFRFRQKQYAKVVV